MPEPSFLFDILITTNLNELSNLLLIKVEKILKVAWIQSHHLHLMGGKVCWMCKGKTLLGVVNKLLKQKVC